MSKPIAGVLPIVHTPFLNDDSLDLASLERQVDWAYQQGADGFCTGMVSELIRLTVDERLELTKKLGELKRDRAAYVAGIGAESTKQALQFGRAAKDAGADAVMAIPPMSTALPDSQLLEYFTTLAEQLETPLIVQDASSYVGQPIPISVCVELLDRFGAERIMFKPEASPIGPHISALRDGSQGRAVMFDGSGGIALVDAYRRGIAGTMPGMEFLPGIVALWQALKRDDETLIYQLYLPICALVALQIQAGLDGFLAVEKYILARRGLFTTERRRKPYGWELDGETKAELNRLLQQLDRVMAEGPEAT